MTEGIHTKCNPMCNSNLMYVILSDRCIILSREREGMDPRRHGAPTNIQQERYVPYILHKINCFVSIEAYFHCGDMDQVSMARF